MEIDIDEDGGFATVATGRDATTTLSIERDHDHIALSLDASWRNSEMSLGVGLSPDQAHSLAEYLSGLAREIEDDREDE